MSGCLVKVEIHSRYIASSIDLLTRKRARPRTVLTLALTYFKYTHVLTRKSNLLVLVSFCIVIVITIVIILVIIAICGLLRENKDRNMRVFLIRERNFSLIVRTQFAIVIRHHPFAKCVWIISQCNHLSFERGRACIINFKYIILNTFMWCGWARHKYFIFYNDDNSMVVAVYYYRTV